MMNHRDIIVFGEDWAALPSSSQLLIEQLSHRRNIIWVNSIGLRQPNLSWHDLKRLWTKLVKVLVAVFAARRHQEIAHPGFVIINPRTLPAPRGKIARFIAAALLEHQLRRVMAQSAIKSPLLWLSLPTAVDMVGRLGESAVVYYCGDDFSALAGVDHQTVIAREQQLVAGADLILTASEVLRAKFPPQRTVTIEHGVDFKLFSTPIARAADLPDDGQPIAGFYGSIAPWLDTELLLEVVGRLRHWNFVFIGDISTDVRALRRCPNVYFLGSRLHTQLPGYSQHWSVSLLPFRRNRQIEACNPLKLREYLAAGRPVVSTEFPAVAPYAALVDIVSDAAAMVSALQRALTAQHSARLSRQAVVNDSWSARATEVATLVDGL